MLYEGTVMKKKLLGIALLLGLMPTMVQSNQSNELQNLANALCRIYDPSCGKAKLRGIRPRDARLKELEKQIRFKDIGDKKRVVTAKTIEYIALKTVRAFEPLIEKITKIIPDQKARASVEKLLPAVEDAIMLASDLISRVATKQYVESLKALRGPLKCLSVPKSQWGTITGCSQFKTYNDVYQLFFKAAVPFLLPLVEALFTGIQVGDKQIRGFVYTLVDIINPKMEKNAKRLGGAFEGTLNIFDQVATGIEKTKRARGED